MGIWIAQFVKDIRWKCDYINFLGVSIDYLNYWCTDWWQFYILLIFETKRLLLIRNEHEILWQLHLGITYLLEFLDKDEGQTVMSLTKDDGIARLVIYRLWFNWLNLFEPVSYRLSCVRDLGARIFMHLLYYYFNSPHFSRFSIHEN